MNKQNFRMSKLDEGYKCSACCEFFSSSKSESKSAKIHVSKSRGCKSSAKRQRIALKILLHQISTGSVERRAGGREHLHHPIEQGNDSPESQDLRLEDNHDANLREVDDATTKWYCNQSNTHTRLHQRVYECFIQIDLRA